MPPRLPKGTLVSLQKFGPAWACLDIPNHRNVSDGAFPWWISPSKNQVYPCFPSRDIYNERILQSDWMRAFWPLNCKTEFSQTRSLHRATGNCSVFHFGLLPAQSNDNFSWKLKNTTFWPHLGSLSIFGQK